LVNEYWKKILLEGIEWRIKKGIIYNLTLGNNNSKIQEKSWPN
jgi:hypothetical protein